MTWIDLAQCFCLFVGALWIAWLNHRCGTLDKALRDRSENS